VGTNVAERGAGPATLTFIRQSWPARIVFGPDQLLAIGAEAERIGAQRVLLIASGSAAAAADRAAGLLGPRLAGWWTEVRSHVPVELAQRARAESARLSADSLVCVGGGAAVGVAKAIALTLELPIIAVPTTYAGSEVTRTWGLTEGTDKTTGRSLAVLPRTVIYDPLLTIGLPPKVSAASGMNAMAHGVDALVAAGTNPATTLLALEAIRYLAAALPRIVAEPGDLDARGQALYAAYLAGTAMCEAGTAVHHQICHVLGGRYNLPHAELHAVLLPHSAALAEAADPGSLSAVAALLGTDSAADGLHALAVRLGLPTSLLQLGVSADLVRSALPALVAATSAQQFPPTAAELAALLDGALTRPLPDRSSPGTQAAVTEGSGVAADTGGRGPS